MAGVLGLEPSLKVLETLVLPLTLRPRTHFNCVQIISNYLY